MSEFAKAISIYEPLVQARLNELRQLVLDTASKTRGVGRIEEALRWKQPSFLTAETGSGSTIRIDGLRSEPERLALYFHCQTDLVETFREHMQPAFVERLDAWTLAESAGMALPPVMIYGDDVTHILTEEGIANLLLCRSDAEREQAIRGVAGYTDRKSTRLNSSHT